MPMAKQLVFNEKAEYGIPVTTILGYNLDAMKQEQPVRTALEHRYHLDSGTY